MAFDGKVNTESVRKLGGQLRQLERKASKRKARRRRAVRRAEYYKDDGAESSTDTPQEQQPESFYERYVKKPFSWF